MHKQKLILHRASMRRYTEEVLWPLGVEVDYVELDVFMSSGDVLDRAVKFEKIYIFDPVNEVLTNRLLAARRQRSEVSNIEFLQSPNFYLKDLEAREYFAKQHQEIFADFYKWQRERFNILIDENYKPVGGEWDYDASSHEKLPSDTQLPSFGVYGDNKHVEEAVAYVNKHFPNNPGSTDFIWPTNHAEAKKWLQDFITSRLGPYGKYQDALDGSAAWLYHSAISSSLNSGLLMPKEVVAAVLEHNTKNEVDLVSLEGFIRRVIGWREFMRGVYIVQGSVLKKRNLFKQHRKLTSSWYSGSLGVPPFDDVVKKILSHGYAHQNERLMVAANFMQLCEISPEDINKWFSELFVDAYDWVVTPNTYGLGQYTDSYHPIVTASEYIIQNGAYQRGEWSDIWDGLFWRFIEKNEHIIKNDPKLKPMLSRLQKLDPDHRRIIGYRAEDFLNKYTIQ